LINYSNLDGIFNQVSYKNEEIILTEIWMA